MDTRYKAKYSPLLEDHFAVLGSQGLQIFKTISSKNQEFKVENLGTFYSANRKGVSMNMFQDPNAQVSFSPHIVIIGASTS